MLHGEIQILYRNSYTRFNFLTYNRDFVHLGSIGEDFDFVLKKNFRQLFSFKNLFKTLIRNLFAENVPN
jgi:hypothetical protein